MSIELTDPAPIARASEILTAEALDFVQRLHERFAPRRDELLLALYAMFAMWYERNKNRALTLQATRC